MLRHITVILIIAATIAGELRAQVSTLTPARFVRSNAIALSFNSPNPVEMVEVYGSIDSGRTWQPVPVAVATAAGVQVEAMQEGRNEFFLVLHNAAGASSDPPVAGTAPHASVVLDTRAPIVQMHQLDIEAAIGQAPLARLRMNIIEEHLSPGGVRLFVRGGPADSWRDAGAIAYTRKQILHTLPADLEGLIDIRLVVTDQAGNRTMEDRFGIEIPDPTVRRTTSPGPALPPTPEVPELEELPPPTDPRLFGLRERGLSHYRQGEYDLAAARLQEALKLAPGNPDLLADLGWTQVQNSDMDQAQDLFGSALQNAPEHLKSLEGLALVQVKQHDYDGARGAFERYLRKAPRDGRMWLNYGDTLHRIGDQRAAERAWEKVLGVDSDLRTASKARERLRVLADPATRAP